MLLHGANDLGYTKCADKLVQKFWKQYSKSGVDLFRVFDSINCTDNLKLKIDAAGISGGIVGGNLYYTWDALWPNKGKYYLEYYIKLTRDLSYTGVHSI